MSPHTPCALSLSGELTIPYAAQHRQDMLAAVAQASTPGGVLALDLSAVEACDSAGIQLLMAARHSLSAGGGQLQITDSSSAMHDALAIYGLGQWAHASEGVAT